MKSKFTNQSKDLKKCSKCLKDIANFYYHLNINGSILCKTCFKKIVTDIKGDLNSTRYPVKEKYSEDELTKYIKCIIEKGKTTEILFKDSHIYCSKNNLSLKFTNLHFNHNVGFKMTLNPYTLKRINKNLFILIKFSKLYNYGTAEVEMNNIIDKKYYSESDNKYQETKINSFLSIINKLNIPENNLLKVEIDITVRKFKWQSLSSKKWTLNDLYTFFKNKRVQGQYHMMNCDNIRLMNSFTKDWMVENILKGKTI